MTNFTPIPQSELDAMQAREEAATEGPWEDTGDAISHEDWSKTEIIYHAGKGDNDCACFIGWKEEDRIFAAHARTDQPRLLDAYEALLAEYNHNKQCLGGLERHDPWYSEQVCTQLEKSCSELKVARNEALAENEKLREGLRESRIKHHHHDDITCPMVDSDSKFECTCGADEENARIDTLLGEGETKG